MADPSAGGSSDRQSHAVSSLLNEAIRLLGASNSEGSSEGNRSQRVAENFRRCFPSLSGIRPSPYSVQDRPRGRSASARRPFVPQNTWTHDVCVLSDVDESSTPNRERLDDLRCRGLGKKRIVFNKNGDHSHFIKKLEEEFPKLKSQNGAIEVLRSTGGGAGNRPITPIPMGTQGYGIQDLRSSVGTAVLYIKPMQSNLQLDPVMQVTDETPKVTCIHCCKMVSLPDLRAHSQSLECTLARPGTSADDDDQFSQPLASVLQQNVVTHSASPGTSSGVQTGQSVSEQFIDNDFARPGTTSGTAPLSGQYGLSARNQQSNLGRGGVSSDVKLQDLKEIFPDISDDKLSEVANRSLSMDDAIDELVEQSTQTLDQVLTQYKTQLQEQEELNLTVERENIWCNILAFYKKALSDKERLKKKLVVTFDGEDGVDAGALSAEFFQLALDQIKKRLFQGQEERVLPVKDSTKSSLFKIAGMIVAHSVLQGGPSFPCLCPALYQYLAGNCEDLALHLDNNDIPMTAATQPVINLIKEIDNCETADDLSNCLTDDTTWNIISASHWPNEVLITLSNKATLVAHMVEHEVVWSRKRELDEFGNGLDMLGLRTILRQDPEVCSSLLCYSHSAFGPEQFEQCLNRPIDPDDFVQSQAYGWFNSYIGENPKSEDYQGGCRLKALFHFSTGFQVPPPGQSPPKITIYFLPDDDDHQFPTAQACFGYLKLPTVHSSKSAFDEAMDKALKFEGTGFSMF